MAGKLLLGEQTEYSNEYNPRVLFGIARTANQINNSYGVDFWRAYEVSWLDDQGKPQIGVLGLSYSSTSPNIVESKSLKLYLNSLNFKNFSNAQWVLDTIAHDVESVVKDKVNTYWITADQHFDILNGVCIDDYALEDLPLNYNTVYQLDQNINDNTVKTYTIYSNLFRSNCPVTAQPDWASVLIQYTGAEWNYSRILSYLLSFREHNAFHEDCVEQIYQNLWHTLQPAELMVYAGFTRRGGIDINPCRSSTPHWLPNAPFRLHRQ